MDKFIEGGSYEEYVDFIKNNFPTDRRFKRKTVMKYVKQIDELLEEGSNWDNIEKKMK